MQSRRTGSKKGLYVPKQLPNSVEQYGKANDANRQIIL